MVTDVYWLCLNVYGLLKQHTPLLHFQTRAVTRFKIYLNQHIKVIDQIDRTRKRIFVFIGNTEMHPILMALKINHSKSQLV